MYELIIGFDTLFKKQNRLVFRLTDSTLRAETAPAVALALFNHLMRDT